MKVFEPTLRAKDLLLRSRYLPAKWTCEFVEVMAFDGGIPVKKLPAWERGSNLKESLKESWTRQDIADYLTYHTWYGLSGKEGRFFKYSLNALTGQRCLSCRRIGAIFWGIWVPVPKVGLQFSLKIWEPLENDFAFFPRVPRHISNLITSTPRVRKNQN